MKTRPLKLPYLLLSVANLLKACVVMKVPGREDFLSNPVLVLIALVIADNAFRSISFSDQFWVVWPLFGSR